MLRSSLRKGYNAAIGASTTVSLLSSISGHQPAPGVPADAAWHDKFRVMEPGASGRPTRKDKLDTHQKAFSLNMEPNRYGTIAEIGAGQEVARWFFRVGGAAGTIAKSMSAYDMAVSDAIYGASTRYVSRERVLTMLGYEYGLLEERLAEQRGSAAQFFVFANTVAARSYMRRSDETHGWMGLRFQHAPGAAPSDIIIHVRMLDAENVQQQEAIGILGVNLIHGGVPSFGRP